jgi:large conductance mechanosensitive channel
LAYGNFIQTLVDFLIVALSLFVVIKVINALRRSTPAASAQPAS